MLSRSAIAGVVAVIVALAVSAAVGSASPAQKAQTDRTRAILVADQMLDHVVLPTGASEIPAAPRSTGDLLARPNVAFWVASQVDRHRFWTTGSSPAAAMASITSHLPKAARFLFGSGGSELMAAYSFPQVDPRSLGARQLVLEALGQASGPTVVRADAEVRYLAPRPYDQRVPTAARVLDITVGSNLERPLLSLTVTKRAVVRRIARIVDSLPFVGNETGVAFSCPAFTVTAPVDRFVFRPAAGPALATVTELASTPTEDYPCFETSLTIRGHREPPLLGGGLLLKQAGSLLHVRLSR
jgi:hypothetical protein